eukprot:151234_1
MALLTVVLTVVLTHVISTCSVGKLELTCITNHETNQRNNQFHHKTKENDVNKRSAINKLLSAHIILFCVIGHLDDIEQKTLVWDSKSSAEPVFEDSKWSNDGISAHNCTHTLMHNIEDAKNNENHEITYNIILTNIIYKNIKTFKFE